MTVCFASHNENKVREIKSILPPLINLKSLSELHIHEEIEENGRTIEENSAIKARYVFEKLKMACIADDTGLEVNALGGAPGVYSARYAGSQRSSEDNMNLLLRNLSSHQDKSAHFKTVITYIDSSGTQHAFEGKVEGEIVEEKRGGEGFGYDPIFQPNGHKVTFAEMSLDEKNKISHRARAFVKLVAFLQTQA